MTASSNDVAPPRSGPRILGVDPGLQVTGYAVIERSGGRPRIVEAGVIRTAECRTTEMAPRLQLLYDGVADILRDHQPEALAVEQLFAHYQHPRTAILMGHARGVILLAAAQRDLPVVSYAATRIKKTVTGSGRASKDQVQRAIQNEFRLTQLPEPSDVADALAVALCHFHTARAAGSERP